MTSVTAMPCVWSVLQLCHVSLSGCDRCTIYVDYTDWWTQSSKSQEHPTVSGVRLSIYIITDILTRVSCSLGEVTGVSCASCTSNMSSVPTESSV